MRTIAILLASALALSTVVGCSQAPEDETAATQDDFTAAERTGVMDGLRAKVKPTLANQDIVFNVQGQGRVIRIEGNWAWLQGAVEIRGGGEPTTRGTVYQDADESGIFDGFRIEALLKKDGNSWKVAEYGLGTTDMWWDGIESRFAAAPRALFPWRDQLKNGDEVVATERMTIMNTLRATVKREIPNQDIVFNVRGEGGAFRMKGDYAWLQGSVELRGGGVPSVKGTAFEAEPDFFDGFHIEALFKKDTNGNWTVANHAIGSTDMWWSGIWEAYPDADRALWGDFAVDMK
jgi:hypothetical protein